jgi:small subunit ribosomal protein S6
MNIECDNETLTELEHAFKFNDAVLRHLTVVMTEAVTTPSAMMKEEKSRSMSTSGEGRTGGGAEQPAPAPAEAAPTPAPAPATTTAA